MIKKKEEAIRNEKYIKFSPKMRSRIREKVSCENVILVYSKKHSIEVDE